MSIATKSDVTQLQSFLLTTQSMKAVAARASFAKIRQTRSVEVTQFGQRKPLFTWSIAHTRACPNTAISTTQWQANVSQFPWPALIMRVQCFNNRRGVQHHHSWVEHEEQKLILMPTPREKKSISFVKTGFSINAGTTSVSRAQSIVPRANLKLLGLLRNWLWFLIAVSKLYQKRHAHFCRKNTTSI